VDRVAAVHPAQMPAPMLDQQEQRIKVTLVVIRQGRPGIMLLAAAVELVG